MSRYQFIMTQKIRETDLYKPVKMFFEAQGYEVKSEIIGCDVVAIKDKHPIAIIELKTKFSLELVLQGIERLSVSGIIYLAVLEGPKSGLKKRLNKIMKLCHMLGFGILLVTLPKNAGGYVTQILEPLPNRPSNQKKSKRLLKEFKNRHGDPNTGGSAATPLITAYKQNALRIVNGLENGCKTIPELRNKTGVQNTASILQKNFYGWFSRIDRGVYALSPTGIQSSKEYAHIIHGLINPYK